MRGTVIYPATPNEISDKIVGQPKGSRVVYHTGFLMADRGDGPLRERSDYERAVHEAGEFAMHLYETGLAVLVQRHGGRFGAEYIAVATGEKPKPH